MPYSTPITRTYIDTRLPPNSPSNTANPLPLLTTLPTETQTNITRFFRAPDRLMSLSSALLKHHFIHTNARIPWSTVSISRTPKPHARPYWSPPPSYPSTSGGLELNVTHQAGMTCLVGCRTPLSVSDEAGLAPLELSSLSSPPTQGGFNSEDPSPRLGVDIACTNERGRTPRDVSTLAELAAWIDVFAEMFSARERDEMKASPPATPMSIEAKLRRFYTSWALKEAFIKLVGEGLLAPWLREVEFLDVRAPSPSKINTWTSPTSDFRILLQGTQLYVDDVKMDVVAFEENFIVATATRGVVDEGDGRWLRLDIERDIRPCAEGRCRCLD